MNVFPVGTISRSLHRRHRDRDLIAAASWPIVDAHTLKPMIVTKDELAEGTVAQDSQLEIPFYFAIPENAANEPSGYFGGHLRTVALSYSEASRLMPRVPEGTIVRVRYNPQNPDQNHTLATDNDGLIPVEVWPS